MLIPGTSFKGILPPLTEIEFESVNYLKSHVYKLADDIIVRNTHFSEGLNKASLYIENQFMQNGYKSNRETYSAHGTDVANIISEIKGSTHPEEIIIIGAHYDTAPGNTPGADDNASGVAGLLELARVLQHQFRRTIRFVAFVNEEPPYFQTDLMGSWVHAKGCRKRNENIVAMLCLESIGYFSDTQKSQQYPAPLDKLYPDVADFIAFCSNVHSYSLLRKCIKSFRTTTQFPSEGLVAPEQISIIGWSDHWSFWQEGYKAIMITDTALFRNSNYHLKSDKPETLDYERMARIVCGIANVIKRLQF